MGLPGSLMRNWGLVLGVQSHKRVECSFCLFARKDMDKKGEDEWQSGLCSVIPENEVGPRMTLFCFCFVFFLSQKSR